VQGHACFAMLNMAGLLSSAYLQEQSCRAFAVRFRKVDARLAGPGVSDARRKASQYEAAGAFVENGGFARGV
jgi:hypothetical protein